jgi:hypothetical protein
VLGQQDGEVTAFALLVTIMLAPVAVVLVMVAVSRRRRGQVVGRWRAAGAASSAVFLVGAVLAAAGWVMPDAFDRLSASERRAIGPALEASPECGLVPFSRVLSVEVRRSPGHGPTLRFTCGLTHLGLPRFSNEAICADGNWVGPGVRNAWNAGSCVEFAGA